MIEKRFTLKEIDNFNYGIKVTNVIMDKEIELPQSTACDLLNEIYDSNKQLKKENEQLKKQVGNLEHTRDYCAECCERLEKEIEQFKQKNEILRQTIERLCEAW